MNDPVILISFLYRRKGKSMTESVTLCSIMRNEGPYLIEWIAYHRALGFSNINIYDNESTDDSTILLETFERAGVLNFIPWTSTKTRSDGVENPQESAYNDCLKNCNTEWMLTLDADEFLVLLLDEHIADFIARFDKSISAVGINWRIFGSSGHVDYIDYPVIERFSKASPRDYVENRHVKSLARVDRTERFGSHMAVIRNGRYTNSAGVDISLENYGLSTSPDHNVAQINHYVIKSQQEFRLKQSKGRVSVPNDDPGKFGKMTTSFFALHDRNDENDESALRFSDRMRSEHNALLKVCTEANINLSELKFKSISSM